MVLKNPGPIIRNTHHKFSGSFPYIVVSPIVIATVIMEGLIKVADNGFAFKEN